MKCCALAVQHIKPLIGHLCYGCIAAHERVTQQKLAENLLLKVFDQLKFTTPLDLKALEFCQRAIFIEDSVTLL